MAPIAVDDVDVEDEQDTSTSVYLIYCRHSSIIINVTIVS